MLVDLVCLYRRGRRRSREEVRAAKPDRGELYIDSVNRYGKRIIVGGFVREGQFEYSVPRLYYVVPAKLRGKNLLLEGTEKVNIGGRVFTDYQQAWWCRIVNVEVRLDDVPTQAQLQAEEHAVLFGNER